MIVIFYIIALVFSVIVHEVSHAYVGLKLGDTTARDAGRITLNPLKHIDIFGSLLLPLLLYFSGGPIVGWAKPVPYNPHRLRHPKQDSGLIALAGPASNLALACIFAILVRIVVAIGITSLPMARLLFFFDMFVGLNIGLALFNLIPIPPLDGSGILFMFLPRHAAAFEQFMRQYGFIILVVLIYSGVQFLGPLIFNAHVLLIGKQAASLLL